MTDELVEGVYELVRTRELDEQLSKTSLAPRFEDIDKDDVPHVLARHISDAVGRALAGLNAQARLDLTNRLISVLHAEGDEVPALEHLVSLIAPGKNELDHPQTPLSDVALLTNADGEPALASEIDGELASSDGVDLLCAFVRFTGIRVLDKGLRARMERGVPLRIITTTYVGATERRALDELVLKYGAQVKIRYDEARTRLHAKAWLFRRNSGFDTGYVGSSNISRSAMLDGLEWNVRISGVRTPNLIRKFEATFDTYWNDPAFIDYNPDTDADRLDAALARERGDSSTSPLRVLSGLELEPRPFQRRILEALDAERMVHGRYRNLVVAATGTGKTVVAAIDYRQMCPTHGERPSLLFVAHRKEILTQALRWYREALNDGAFGELFVDGQKPTAWRHVFASIQSLRSEVIEDWERDKFDVVVVDEFHHADAKSYRRLLNWAEPRELLGLTATPERADGVNVIDHFGGRAAFELRLWSALQEGLLCPFHYFGVSDNMDLSNITWRRGGYDLNELAELYTGNDARVRLVLKALQDRIADPSTMRALGFCVSVQHAEYMAHKFNQHGIESKALSGETSRADRDTAFAAFRDGQIKCLFAVDLFNEGLDIPDVDTILMLRPTESATVFLQQLGRGLRLTRNKPVLTVLDFIGYQSAEFRFDTRYCALTGVGRSALKKQVEEDFPYLPSGCSIVLDKVAQQTVLESVKRTLRMTRKQLVADVRAHGQKMLADFLDESGHELSSVYPKHSWTALTRDAGLVGASAQAGGDEEYLLSKVSALTHVDDLERAAVYRRLVAVDGTEYRDLSARERAYARMLTFVLFPKLDGIDSYGAALRRVRSSPAVCGELSQVLRLSFDGAQRVTRPLEAMGLRSLPLYSHASYRREEVLAAIEWASLGRKVHGHAGGVAWAPETGVDALFVTLHKDEGQFSPTTMYRDFPISRELFHWESQNTARPTTGAGRRYLHHRDDGTHVLLLTRDRNYGELGSSPYVLLGDVEYVDHRGEKPIAITWKLKRPMPADVLQSGSVVAE